MKIKHVYIYPEEEEMGTEKFIAFRENDIKKYNIKSEDIFADITIKHAIEEDIVHELYGWDAVRIIHPTKGEMLFLEINGKIRVYDGTKHSL